MVMYAKIRRIFFREHHLPGQFLTDTVVSLNLAPTKDYPNDANSFI